MSPNDAIFQRRLSCFQRSDGVHITMDRNDGPVRCGTSLSTLNLADMYNFGAATVIFNTARVARTFTVHEDLICQKSSLFRRERQKSRKAIEGDCPIYWEAFNLRFPDVDFCRAQCGQNFHNSCIGKWRANNTTCPTCREPCIIQAFAMVHVPHVLDQAAVQEYVNWIYRGRISITSHSYMTNGTLSLRLLQAWQVAWTFQDKGYRNIAQV